MKLRFVKILFVVVFCERGLGYWFVGCFLMFFLDVDFDAGVGKSTLFLYYNYIGFVFHLKLFVHSQNLQ